MALASYAIQKIHIAMVNEQVNAGLFGDQVLQLNLQSSISNAVQAGKIAAEKGECNQMTAASRGRLRSLVSEITRY